MKKITAVAFSILLSASVLLSACSGTSETKPLPDSVDLQILATSDLHGKFYPWDYITNEESKTGSMTQLATAIEELRTENSLLLDAGDTVQDNDADIFMDEEIHPMIQALNTIGYDAWTTGNHEYDYDMDTLKRVISTIDAKVLLNNVYDEDNNPLADGYAIFEKGGVKIGVIGMVTPLIGKISAENLAGYTVTDPVEETKKIIEEIEDETDVLIALTHMGINNEYDEPDSGVKDLANACPQLDVIIASHEHNLVESEEINGVLVVENKFKAQTMSEIHLKMKRNEEGWKIENKSAVSHNIGDYEPDTELMEALLPYHEDAIADSESVIGELKGGNLAPEDEINGIPTALIEDTALMDLINEAQLYYTDADISASALSTLDANLHEGPIRKCDVSLIYKYPNTLYKVKLTGAQLKKYMEWCANFYNQYKDGYLTISFNPDIAAFNMDMFDGVNYKIDISEPEGSRIKDLTWPDGSPVDDDDEFTLAVHNYRVNAHLMTPGMIFEEGDLPEILEVDVRSDIGTIPDLLKDYIENAKGGIIYPEADNNWKIVGNDWDEGLHKKAAHLINEGKIELKNSENGWTPNIETVTEDDLE